MVLKTGQPKEMFKINQTFDEFLQFSLDNNALFVKVPKQLLKCGICNDSLWILYRDIDEALNGRDFLGACGNCLIVFTGNLSEGTPVQ